MTSLEPQHDGSAELMLNAAGVFLILLMIFIPLTQLEKLTYIENQVKDEEGSTQAPDTRELALLEVEYREGLAPLFHWKPAKSEAPRTTTDYDALLDYIEGARPNALWLRLDGRVESMVFQKLILDAERLGIALWQGNQ